MSSPIIRSAVREANSKRCSSIVHITVFAGPSPPSPPTRAAPNSSSSVAPLFAKLPGAASDQRAPAIPSEWLLSHHPQHHRPRPVVFRDCFRLKAHATANNQGGPTATPASYYAIFEKPKLIIGERCCRFRNDQAIGHYSIKLIAYGDSYTLHIFLKWLLAVTVTIHDCCPTTASSALLVSKQAP